MLSTGEVRVADKLVESGQRARAGQQVRLIDIPAEAGQDAMHSTMPVPNLRPRCWPRH